MDDKTIVFSSILNPYINDTQNYIFIDLNTFSERKVENVPYCEGDYDSLNKLFIIHRLKTNIYLQLEMTEDGKKKWSIVKEKNNKFSFIQKFNDKNLFGSNLFFLSENVLITWDFLGKKVKIVAMIKIN